jgi:hypothetical protein
MQPTAYIEARAYCRNVTVLLRDQTDKAYFREAGQLSSSRSRDTIRTTRKGVWKFGASPRQLLARQRRQRLSLTPQLSGKNADQKKAE